MIVAIICSVPDYMMLKKQHIYIFLLFISTLSVRAQEFNATTERTPEMEAAIQTEKLRNELSLSKEQTVRVHEIMLKYARARQVSNSRAEALQRMKDKEAELIKILNKEQRTKLQNKRYKRSSFRKNNTYNNVRENDLRKNNTQNPPSSEKK